MNRARIGRSLLYVAALPSAGFGLSYFVSAFAASGWAAAYHQRLAQGLPFAELPPPLATLYTTLVGVIGTLFLATAVGQLILAWHLDEGRDTRAAWWALLGWNAVGLGGLILVNLRNGLDSPWWLNGLVLALVGAALALTRPAAQA